eukprot:13754078-Alexandrium_andersonii.AAC.1
MLQPPAQVVTQPQPCLQQPQTGLTAMAMRIPPLPERPILGASAPPLDLAHFRASPEMLAPGF